MIRKIILSAFPIFLLLVSARILWANGEIQIQDTRYKKLSADKFEVSALLVNTTKQSREVTVRGQLFFFEQASPKGDKPAMILRKDETLVLKSREYRKIRILLINEGSFPKGQLRLRPEVRQRRQRVWNY